MLKPDPTPEQIMETTHIDHKKLGNLLKILSKPDAIRILFFADQGIRNSTHAREELGLSTKRYYTRLRALLGEGLVIKSESGYRQTALGNMFCSRFLPAMGRACDSKDKLELLMQLGDTQIENSVRTLIEEDLKIPDFGISTKVKIINDYESLVIDLMDLCNEAENNILLASNYADVRVIDAVIRSHKRGVNFRLIMGEQASQSKLNQLRLMLSPRFAKSMLEFMSIPDDLGEMTRVTKLAYSFCIIDGSHYVYEVINPTDMEFLFASFVNDKRLAEKMIDSFEKLWETGKPNNMLNFFSSLKKN